DGPATAVLQAGFQGCNERLGICYPPINKKVELKLPAPGEDAGSSSAGAADGGTPLPEVPPVPEGDTSPAPDPQASQADQPPLSEQGSLAQSLATGNTILVLGTFFGLGLLLAFTPCVFPMIPILSSIIAGQGAGLTTGRAFTMSLVYVLAMAVTYTVAGVVAALLGANIQAAFQDPWVLSAFAAVFVLLALSMFGFYDLQLPAGLQSRLTAASNRQEGGSLTGVAIMGLLSALIVGPCVAPPLMGALIYISQTGDPWLGGTALFFLSLGMGAPLLLIGTSAGKLLPRAGGWMEAVKAVFGVLLLAVAIYLLERILPGIVVMALWALLLLISAVYLGALEPLGEGTSGWRRLWKGIGVVLLIYGALLLVGAASGGKDPLAPLGHVRVAGGGQPAHLEFQRVKTVEELQAKVAAASRRNQPVMLDFYADWCISCKEFEKYTFSDPGVQRALEGTLLLQADVTANDAEDKALLKHFDLIGPPAILFWGPDGTERKNYRVVGFMNAEEFRGHVESAL
ncbi:MAG TPA: protein-disulfide reductase DsbD, partial [Gammaproteobacteria bacterium]|nr:protein-disulfide reductase DsbD [Gammaproteobacteria bacterium]